MLIVSITVGGKAERRLATRLSLMELLFTIVDLQQKDSWIQFMGTIDGFNTEASLAHVKIVANDRGLSDEDTVAIMTAASPEYFTIGQLRPFFSVQVPE